MNKRIETRELLGSLKIDTRRVKARVNRIINDEPEEKRKFIIRKTARTLLIAAAIAAVCLATAFAADNIISYFSSGDAKHVGDIVALTKYNEEIGAEVTRGDKKLVLDNITADDSYLYVFYTLTSPPDYTCDIICGINGKRAINVTTWDSYRINENTMRGVEKISVANMDIPDEFTFEMYCAEDGSGKEYYYNDDISLTESDKESLLYISAQAHKADIMTETLTSDVNAFIPSLNITVDKVVFSPLGSQLVITQHEINRRRLSECFALTDENGAFIYLISEQRIYDEGDAEEIRTIPFSAGGRIPESITLIPYKEKSPSEIIYTEAEHKKAADFPVELSISDRGKLIVTDVRYLDAKIEIDYYLEGSSYGLYGVYPADSSGIYKIAADDGVWSISSTEAHENTGSYTAVYEFVTGEADQNGNVKSAGAARSADTLKAMYPCVKISFDPDAPPLDYDNAVKIDLTP